MNIISCLQYILLQELTKGKGAYCSRSLLLAAVKNKFTNREFVSVWLGIFDSAEMKQATSHGHT
jgi:hypothetical protein